MQASGGVITSESVWNDGALGGAGGGGISDFFPLPSWQTSAGIPPSVNPAGRTGRGLPDLAGHADESTGYQVRVDDLDTVIGGTSAVAPLTAGLVALCNESLGTNIGFLNPLLYGRLGKNGVFRDITSGNNDMTGHVGGYKAGPGWDACSGFGSPDGAALLAALKTPKHKAAASQGGPSRGDLQAPEKDEGATEGSTATRATRHSKKRA